MATQIGGTEIIFGDRRQPKALPLSHPKARWGAFGTETTILPKGYTRRRGCLSLPCDIKFERDIPVQLRDGTTIYVDVYRPTNEMVKCPALIAWSPYGKQGGQGNQVLDDFPFRMGVPLRGLSELQKWEGPDPGYWVNHGYAVINPDPRGAGKSGGDIYQFGSQEGRDGADVVEWVGERDWCSGKVALSGNSYLAISQWFIAAERPKHLAAIAPWEGLTDLYNEGMAAGGVITKPSLDFSLGIIQVNAGENSWENTVEMAIRHKIYGAYHDDKRAKIENINVPAYVVACWSNPIHTYGTFRGYEMLPSQKWLRIHDNWEWPDYYEKDNRTDLHRFFDHYLKGIDNGWESTPRVRAKIINTGNPLPKTGTNFVSTAFPPPEAKPLKLFLDNKNNSLSSTQPPEFQLKYKASNEDITFHYTFLQDSKLCGKIEMALTVSLLGADDSDIFVTLEKVLKSGGIGSQLKIPYEKSYQSMLIRSANRLGVSSDTNFLFYKGPTGQIRVSRRALGELSLPGLPVSDMKKYQPLKEGEIVQVQMGLTPIGMSFAAGEKLRIRISGVDTLVFPPVDQATLEVEGVASINDDVTVVLHGGLMDGLSSHIILPVLD